MQETTTKSRCSQEQLKGKLIKYMMVPSPCRFGILMFTTYQFVLNTISGVMVMPGSMLLMGVLQYTLDSYLNLMHEALFESYLICPSLYMVLFCCD
jgi:hypothetical protein